MIYSFIFAKVWGHPKDGFAIPPAWLLRAECECKALAWPPRGKQAALPAESTFLGLRTRAEAARPGCDSKVKSFPLGRPFLPLPAPRMSAARCQHSPGKARGSQRAPASLLPEPGGGLGTPAREEAGGGGGKGVQAPGAGPQEPPPPFQGCCNMADSGGKCGGVHKK